MDGTTATSQLIARLCALPDGTPLESADAAALADLAERYPAATLPAILMLRHCPDASALAALQERTALLTSDRRTLTFAAHGDEWAKFYPTPEEAPAMQTNDVIDTFLTTYGSCTPEEEALLERMIFNPTPDYAEMLAREEQLDLPADNPEAEADPQDKLINAFIRERHPAAHPPQLMPEPEPEELRAEEEEAKPIARPEHADDSLLSESLAKIFIKRGRYEKAYEIISGLNLKFPKKSAYFADQLRFLQKLIINQRRLSQEKGSGTQDK